jgi:hypothetical protein
MHGRTLKIGAGMLAAAAIVTFVAPSSAFADYAPAGGDIVGVGSDTLQAMVDFGADGDYVGDPGYNGAGNKFKIISIDATADANTRLAYGPGGANGYGTAPVAPGTGALITSPAPAINCAPGTGAKIATGSLTTGDSAVGDLPCVLNPTVVLRAGLAPEQRPNGSGAGFKLLAADTVTAVGATLGNPIGNGGKGLVNFARASSSQVTANTAFNSVTLGTDVIQMLAADGSASAPTNAIALTAPQLTQVYNCTLTDWGTAAGGSASGNTILPLLPQVGSGTRKTFLAAISVTTPGNCVQNVEENDPTAVQDSSSPANAVEPMSSTRLNLFQGKGYSFDPGTSSFVIGSLNPTGYFKDASCPFNPTTSAQGATTNPIAGTGNGPTACQAANAALSPKVQLLSGAGKYATSRDLLVYFRTKDIDSTIKFQPGGTLNWVRTLFYNPCPVGIGDPAFAADGCSIDGVSGIAYGSGGAPYYAGAAGQATIGASGVLPHYAWNGTSE